MRNSDARFAIRDNGSLNTVFASRQQKKTPDSAPLKLGLSTDLNLFVYYVEKLKTGNAGNQQG
jgi:hypothetical protein